jgi:hypothetical protein
MHIEELQNLYSSPNILIMMKSRWMRWAGHVALIRKKRKAYRILVEEPEGNRHKKRPRCWWENSIKMDIRETGCNGLDLIHLAQDRNQ